MWTLAFIGLIIYLSGWYRTLVLFVSIIVSTIFLVISLGLSVVLSIVFWPESMKNTHVMDGSWTNIVGNSDSFGVLMTLPAVFILDLYRGFIYLIVFETNLVFLTIGTLYAYIFYRIWEIAIGLLIKYGSENKARE